MSTRSYGSRPTPAAVKADTHHFECHGCGKECEAERRNGWRSKCCGQYVAVVRNPEPMREGALMPTLASLKVFLTAAVTRAYYVMFSKTSCAAKAATAGTSPTPTTSAERSSRMGPGAVLPLLLDSGTPSTPTTSDATSPGSSTSSSAEAFLRAAPEAGHTAGGPETSRDCCYEALPPNWRTFVQEHPSPRYELLTECPTHGAVFWWRMGAVEARN